MAKAKAECICRVCGEKFYKEKICYNRQGADEWEDWASSHYDLCPSCYGRQMREKEIDKGLYVDICLDSKSIFQNTMPIAIVFGGDTMPYKDQIKTLKAFWTDEYPSEGILGDLLGMGYRTKKWVLYCDLENLNEKLLEVKEIGATVNNRPSDTDIELYLSMKEELRENQSRKEEKIMQEIGEKPAWPDEIKALWPDGASWNGKFYGKEGNWAVYLSGEKVKLSNNQKTIMEGVVAARDSWKIKYNQLKNS